MGREHGGWIREEVRERNENNPSRETAWSKVKLERQRKRFGDSTRAGDDGWGSSALEAKAAIRGMLPLDTDETGLSVSVQTHVGNARRGGIQVGRVATRFEADLTPRTCPKSELR